MFRIAAEFLTSLYGNKMKKRAHELAKELGISSKQILVVAEGMGINLKTASSSVDVSDVEKIKKSLSSPSSEEAESKKPSEKNIKVVESSSGQITETRSTERVVRRRKKWEKSPPVKTPEETSPDLVSEQPPEPPSPAKETEAAKTASTGKSAKRKPAEVDSENEKLVQRMRDALVPKLTPKKKEYVVDEKGFRKKHDIRRKKPPHFRTTGSNKASKLPASAPAHKKAVKIGETITLDDLARRMEVSLREVRVKAKNIGLDTRPNNPFDYETATLIAAEYGLDVEVDRFDEGAYLDDKEAGFENEMPRPPVVSVMGHVDHGKTTLLDTLRESNIALGEAGGITQGVGAYKVPCGDRQIVFIDTPGHEAFTAMRARGAKINDIAILVVAADDGVKEQTLEAANHVKAAGVPIIVAINKIDKEDADPENVKRQLSEHGLVSEEWGGDTLFTEISAKTGQGLKEILELILLQADILELKAPYKGLARGIVLESRLDKGRGAIADVIVTKGCLKVGDHVVAGLFSGKVRALMDENGTKLKSAEPSMPVEVMGFAGVPGAGESFYAVRDEKTARAIVENRRNELGQTEAPSVPQPLSLGSLEMKPPEEDTAKELSLVIKADTQGSVEAIKDSIAKIETEKCSVKVAHSAVGGISGTDVDLAHVTGAFILGFNVRPDSKAASDASERGVLVETYSVVYEIMERIKQIMEGLLDPLVEEKTVGHAQVKEIFRMSGQRTIAGCVVNDGKVLRGEKLRVVRDGVVVFESKVGSLKRFKEDVREVQSGYECGLTIENFNDVKTGDVLEIYSEKETAQQL